MSVLFDAFVLSLAAGVPLRIAIRLLWRRRRAAPVPAGPDAPAPARPAGARAIALRGACAAVLALLALYLWSAPVRAEIPGGEALMAVSAICWGLAEAAFRARSVALRIASGTGLAALLLAVGLACLLFGLLGAPDRLFRGRTLLALARVQTSVFEQDTLFEHPLVDAKVKKGCPRVDLEVRILEGGRPGEPRFAHLPGDQWGIGMQAVTVNRWLVFFGPRFFYRVISAEAKFSDPAIFHGGTRFEHPLEAEANLRREIPVVGQTLGSLSGAEAQKFLMEVYRPVADGAYWAIWASPGGPPTPEKITPEEWARRIAPER